MRKCPLCDQVTPERVCPQDRMATLLVDTDRFSGVHPELGQVLAERYQLEERIGHGGYGQVFRARHLGTGQDVAVKVLIPQPGTDDGFMIKRFFLEARVTSGLQHAHTVNVFDFGQEDSGVVYLAMELLQGQTLREDLRERRKNGLAYSEREAVELGVAVTRSLQEAHEAGLVHRDLKPDNIFLHRVGDDDPVVKILDFGIVKLGDGQHTLSSTTSVPGTPSYMSPEHALNQDVDGRSDLYSLGVILYQLVTLDLPFRGPSDPQTLYMHAYEPVPDIASRALTPLSDGFCRLINVALAKRPRDRHADARAMRDALKACQGDGSVPSRPTGPLPSSQTLDGASPMMTPQATTGMLSPVGERRPTWEKWAYVAGAIGILVSIAALLATLYGEPKTVTVEKLPVRAPPPAKVAPPTQAAPPPAEPPPTAEVTPPAEPKRSKRRKASKRTRRARRKKTPPPSPPVAPPPPPEISDAEKRKRKLLEIDVEDLK